MAKSRSTSMVSGYMGNPHRVTNERINETLTDPQMSNWPKERKGGEGYSGGGTGWAPQMLHQKNIIAQVGYSRGRAGHCSGEPFLVEFQVPE
ncbi:hypothetical protein GOBAR_AA18797 [Gossypium barbadense]|uniref:Uncharacterized protein n=1 Tax=Gossypium barbadense TaxID=3634 RepID=A0A2P5XEU5_GOSBA|nr:hypothetical protein GOBAR_AA18797 [Gossypium barbadense]